VTNWFRADSFTKAIRATSLLPGFFSQYRMLKTVGHGCLIVETVHFQIEDEE